jgi:phage shock protein E
LFRLHKNYYKNILKKESTSARRDTMLFNSTGCKNIGPETLNEKMNSGEDFFLLDVRTPQENATHAIPGSYLIPLQDLRYRMNELPKDKEIVVYCRVGNRSAYACSHLSRMGYNVKNLEGGIMIWNMVGNASLAKA